MLHDVYYRSAFVTQTVCESVATPVRCRRNILELMHQDDDDSLIPVPTNSRKTVLRELIQRTKQENRLADRIRPEPGEIHYYLEEDDYPRVWRGSVEALWAYGVKFMLAYDHKFNTVQRP